MLIDQIIQELPEIPEEKLSQLYEIIYYFRLGLSKEIRQPCQSGLLKEKLGETFFEPLPEDELKQ